MTTERELLTLAAKAAGIKLSFDPYGVPRDCTGMDPAMNIYAAKEWNPIIDDGDALRLAVKCRIDFCEGAGRGPETWAGYYKRGFVKQHFACEPHAADPYAAARRVIVRAAAEMGMATQASTSPQTPAT